MVESGVAEGGACLRDGAVEVPRADKLLLGAGHFDGGMKVLNESGPRDALDGSLKQFGVSTDEGGNKNGT